VHPDLIYCTRLRTSTQPEHHWLSTAAAHAVPRPEQVALRHGEPGQSTSQRLRYLPGASCTFMKPSSTAAAAARQGQTGALAVPVSAGAESSAALPSTADSSLCSSCSCWYWNATPSSSCKTESMHTSCDWCIGKHNICRVRSGTRGLLQCSTPLFSDLVCCAVNVATCDKVNLKQNQLMLCC
jgi:hypothetical protein